jgi:hypothetical protein
MYAYKLLPLPVSHSYSEQIKLEGAQSGTVRIFRTGVHTDVEDV